MKSKTGYRLAISLVMAVGISFLFIKPSFCAEADKKEEPTDTIICKAFVDGNKLKETEALVLEKVLSQDPNDLIARSKLLAYYNMKRFSSISAKQKYQDHVLWIIQNKPESYIAGQPYAQLDMGIDDQYRDGKLLWIKQIESHPNNVVILGNASNYFGINDQDLSVKYLKKAQELEPANPKWPGELGQLFINMTDNKTSMKDALEQLEKSYSLEKDNDTRNCKLNALAKVSFEAGDVKKAENYASELLKSYSDNKTDWNYGNAIHDGNMVLGRVALKSGDIEKAKKYLIESAKILGSPQLSSFGPNMSLVKDLLDKGEKESVLQYFEMISKFWKSNNGKLEQWKEYVKKGVSPDFGANLVY